MNDFRTALSGYPQAAGAGSPVRGSPATTGRSEKLESESLPDWFNQKFYLERIKPKLKQLQVRIAHSGLAVSEPYALRIRNGTCIPHPRH